MQPTAAGTRALSATIFGNEKMAEVIVALNSAHPATAQEVSDLTGMKYPLVRDVLIRLEKGGLLTSARTGGGRSALLYDFVDEALWPLAIRLAQELVVAGSRTT